MANRNRNNIKRSERGRQGRKDSRGKRINLDNERESKFAKEFTEASKAHEGNDLSWYWKNPELAKSAGSIGFSQTTGVPDGNGAMMPGVMVLPFATSIGGIRNTAINQAARDIYSYTVHANSRNTSYDSQDQMMIILGARDIFAAVAHLIRAYGVMLKYKQENAYIPRAIITASGLDFNDLLSNYHKMLFDINSLIAETRQLWVPKSIPALARAFWLSTNIYTDANNNKAQYYMFVPGVLRYYSPTTDTDGAQLLPYSGWHVGEYSPNTSSFSNLMKWDDAIAAVRYCLRQLINSTDRGVIMGDIMKAFGESNLFTINFIDTSYNVEPVYNMEVLTQIENLTSINISDVTSTVLTPSMIAPIFSANVTNNTITEAPNYAAFDANDALYSALRGRAVWPNSCQINFHTGGQPTPEMVMEASRLITIGNQQYKKAPPSGTSQLAAIVPKFSGTETIINPFIIRYSATLTNGDYGILPKPIRQQISTESADIDFGGIAMLSNFDWAPWMTQRFVSAGTDWLDGPGTAQYYMADADNYIIVDSNVIERLHRAAILSEFGVPIL